MDKGEQLEQIFAAQDENSVSARKSQLEGMSATKRDGSEIGEFGEALRKNSSTSSPMIGGRRVSITGRPILIQDTKSKGGASGTSSGMQNPLLSPPKRR